MEATIRNETTGNSKKKKPRFHHYSGFTGYWRRHGLVFQNTCMDCIMKKRMMRR